MNLDELSRRYEELQHYVGWTDEDAHRVAQVGPLVAPRFPALVDDFYDEVQRHPGARKVITGGEAQILRLKGTLTTWLTELVAGTYDLAYVRRRWQVGWRHVEIGLDQVYTNVALARLRAGLVRALSEGWTGAPIELTAILLSLNKLLDLDLAIIEDAYQTEYLARQQRSDRLAAVGQVSAGVAHELRNPLNVVKTSVYYLLNARNPSPAKVAEHLQRIARQVDLADSVITALSRFAKMPVPERRPTTVAALVTEVLEMNPPGESVVTTVDCPADLPSILVDAEQIRIVLANLVRNARDAMPQGGHLTVACRRADPDAIEMDVIDTGVGIPPENLPRVMEPLFSTKARGLGLGLSMARAILDKNGGALRVTSAPGQGSTFTLRLPAAPAAP